MNDEDAKKFYAAADAHQDIRYKTAAMLLPLTGMRRGELCGLEWSNIDFEEATITIERSTTTVAGIGLMEKEPKAESSKCVIAISDKFLSVLTEYKVWYDQHRRDMGDRWKGTDRIFITECGAQIYPGTVYTWMHKVCDAAGLPHGTVYSLRRTNNADRRGRTVGYSGGQSRPCADKHYDEYLQSLPEKFEQNGSRTARAAIRIKASKLRRYTSNKLTCIF